MPSAGTMRTGSFSRGLYWGVWVVLFQGTSVMSSKGMSGVQCQESFQGEGMHALANIEQSDACIRIIIWYMGEVPFSCSEMRTLRAYGDGVALMSLSMAMVVYRK